VIFPGRGIMPVLSDLAAWEKIPSQVQAYFFSNENLITGELINWSYSQNLVRIKLPVGVSYEADLEKARDLRLATAGRTKRFLHDPSPSCRFVGLWGYYRQPGTAGVDQRSPEWRQFC
jgi:hypothetical protein